MIRVELGQEINRRGIFEYRVPSLQIVGRSRQPLLDACRQIKSTGAFTGDEQVAIYREGKTGFDMCCSLEWGAAHTVKEPSVGRAHFAKYEEVDWAAYQEAAE